MVTMELTSEITEEQLQLLAIAAANVAGGRHEFRADATIRQESKALVAEMRKVKRNEAKRETYKWRNVGERFALDMGYDEEMSSRIDAWQDALKARPHSETHMRNIARALFNPRAFERFNSDAENVEEYRTHVLANWRSEVRAYAEWKESVADIGMTIPLSLGDMRADHGSRFFNYAVKKWNLAGYGEFLFGADVQDAFQTAMAECIANGDWVNPSGDGRVKGNRVPLYGALWRHVALAVRRAVWQNTRFTYDTPEPEFSWEEWERTPQDKEAYALRFALTGSRQSLAEWAEWDEYRAIREATEATRERIIAERESRLGMLDASRKAIAQLVMSGMTVQRIANALGRKVESLAADLDTDEMRPTSRFLPRRGMTESERAEKLEFAQRMEAHAANLRMKYRDMQADNYANGRVFRRGNGSTRSALAFTLASEETRIPGDTGSVVAQGSGYLRTVDAA